MHKIVLILLAHWVADFLFQSDEVAKYKSKSIAHLTMHGLLYSVHLFIWSALIFNLNYQMMLLFMGINGVTHVCIDAVTSKVAAFCHKHDARHGFFTVIGFDQFLHVSILLVSYFYIWGGC